MDSVAAIKQVIFDTLSEDPALQGYGLVVANVWPEPDEVFPYLVYRATANPVSSLDVMAVATVTIDIWDKDDTQARLSEIRARVSLLLEGLMTQLDEISMRFRKGQDIEFEEDERYVWRSSTQWLVRYTRNAEMSLLA